jgi:hypothetical protein
MKTGKFDLKTWTYNGIPLYNPFRILWNLLMAPIFFSVLFMLCLMVFLITLDRDCFKETWDKNCPF